MIVESKVEYEEICGQVGSASDSVTRYSIALIGGSGTAFIGLLIFVLRIDVSKLVGVEKDIYYLKLSFVLILISIFTLSIQIIINYKCASHNRLAAYRNLLAAEVVKNGKSSGSNKFIVSFDVCMDHLNHCISNKILDLGFVSGELFERSGIFSKLSGHSTAIDEVVAESFPVLVDVKIKNKYYVVKRHDFDVCRCFVLSLIKYICIIYFGLYKNGKSSWDFPARINGMVSFIVFLEFGSSIYFRWGVGCFVDANFFSFLFLVMVALVLMHKVAIEVQDLLIGGKRISSYFCQFIPFRLMHLVEFFGGDVKPYYVGKPWEQEYIGTYSKLSKAYRNFLCNGYVWFVK